MTVAAHDRAFRLLSTVTAKEPPRVLTDGRASPGDSCDRLDEVMSNPLPLTLTPGETRRRASTAPDSLPA
jgi:hypothetical protein